MAKSVIEAFFPRSLNVCIWDNPKSQKQNLYVCKVIETQHIFIDCHNQIPAVHYHFNLRGLIRFLQFMTKHFYV